MQWYYTLDPTYTYNTDFKTKKATYFALFFGIIVSWICIKEKFWLPPVSEAAQKKPQQFPVEIYITSDYTLRPFGPCFARWRHCCRGPLAPPSAKKMCSWTLPGQMWKVLTVTFFDWSSGLGGDSETDRQTHRHADPVTEIPGANISLDFFVTFLQICSSSI